MSTGSVLARARRPSWSITQHRATLAVLGLQVAGTAAVALYLLAATDAPIYWGLLTASVAVVLAGLLLAYRRGWRYAGAAAVLVVTLVLALALPEPFVSRQATAMVLVPPVLALVVAGPATVVASVLLEVALLLARAGGQGIYASPVTLIVLGMLIGGLIVSRLTVETSLLAASVARNAAERNAQALQASEAQYRLLFDGHPQPLWVYDLETLAFLAVNDAAVEHYGYSRDEFLALTIKDIRPAEDVPRLLASVAQVPAGIGRAGLWRHRTKDGRLIDVTIVSHALTFAERRADLVMAADVTERLRAEAARRASEERLQTTLDSMLEGGQIIGFDWRYLYVNDAAALHGHKPKAELLGRTMMDAYPGIERTALFATLRRCMAERSPERLENEYTYADGSTGWFVLSVQPVPEGLFILSQDITDRKRAEAAQRDTERRFRALIENSADAITLLAADGTVVYDSPAASGLLGYGPTEWLGRNAFELLHPDDVAPCQRLLSELAQQPGTRDYASFRLGHKDGAWRWMEAVASNLLAEPAVRAIVVNYRDVTDRKQAEQALLASEKRFRALIENAPDGITLVDGKGRVLYTSPSVERILGYAPSEAVGKNAAAFVHPDDLPVVRRRLAEMARQPGEIATVEYRFRHRDGSWRWLESRVTNLLAEPAVRAIIFNYRDVTERKQADAEIRRQLDRLAALRVIDVAITSSLDVRLTLDVLLQQVTEQLGVDAADVLLLKPSTQTLAYAAGRGFRRSALGQTRQRLGEGHAGQAALERRLVHVPDLRAAAPRFRRTGLLAGEEFVSYFGAPLISKGQVQGVLEVFHRAALTPDDDWRAFLDVLAGQAAIAVDNAQLFDNLQRTSSELLASYDATIEGWSRALDLRDKETEGHSQRVTELTLRLARTFGWSEAELVHMRRGALLHDMGKLGVPDSILLKPGKLTDAEWDVMRQHPRYAYEMLAPIAYLRPALEIPYCHHEKWDGTGYPRGLKGEQIPLAARIFAVADVWDALRSDRPYRSAWPEAKVREQIRQLAGSHFDPQVVERFLALGVSDL